MGLLRFVFHSVRLALSGGWIYRGWLALLLVLALWGSAAYVDQLRTGLIVTHMRDQVSWAFYIGNFTFLVGVAAAAIIVVIPAYIYHWGPIKEVVILGEILAISALVMCMLFVTVDVGRPDRLWHLLPVIGGLNWPISLLAWDIVVLNLYFGLNIVIVGYLLFCAYSKRPYNKAFVVPLVLLSVPAALSIHTVTAFIYNGLPGRPFWNASILAPRFIVSALCSGPAILLILFQILRRWTRFEIKQEAIWKIAELMAYAMFLNLFLLGAETFRELYSGTEHMIHFVYLFRGVEGHTALVPYAWASVTCSVVAFLLFLIPRTRRHPITLNLGCLLIYCGVYIEKGMGLVIPGFTPDTLGEIYEYTPTLTEIRIGVGIFSIGFLVYTCLTKVAVAILTGELNVDTYRAAAPLAMRQRFLSQRMTKEALLARLGVAADQNRQALAESITLFDASLTQLTRGDEATHVLAPTNDALRAQLAKCGAAWATLRPLLEKADADLVQLAAASTAALVEAEAAVLLYEADARSAGFQGRGAAVNIAGRQRALTQRMANEVLFIALGAAPADHRRALGEVRAQFTRQLAALQRGDAELGVTPPTDEHVVEELQAVEQAWQRTTQELDKLGDGAVSAEDATCIVFCLDETLRASIRALGAMTGMPLPALSAMTIAP